MTTERTEVRYNRHNNHLKRFVPSDGFVFCNLCEPLKKAIAVYYHFDQIINKLQNYYLKAASDYGRLVNNDQ